MSRTATEVRRLSKFRGDARLYHLSEPVRFGHRWDDDEGKVLPTTEYVIVSAAVAFDQDPETYIFPAAENADEPLEWVEMEGSFRGALDHAQALRGLGFEVIA